MKKQQTLKDPDGMNEERTTRAAIALQSYLDIDGTDPDDFMTDVLADFMHYCAVNDIDFGAHLVRAHMHFEEETESDATWHAILDSVLTEETNP